MMLSYTPVLDIYHTSLRSLAVLTRYDASMELDGLKIIQFYLAMPAYLRDFSFTRDVSKALVLRSIEECPPPYAQLPPPKVMFTRAEGVADAAIRGLVAKNILNLDGYRAGVAEIGTCPKNILNICQEYSASNEKLLSALSKLSSLPLYGVRGLKALSGLKEYRYDNV